MRVPCIGRQILTTGLPGKSPINLTFNNMDCFGGDILTHRKQALYFKLLCITHNNWDKGLHIIEFLYDYLDKGLHIIEFLYDYLPREMTE